MHLRFGMIWAAVATILVGLGTSAEQSRSARLLGSEVPAKRKLRSDNLINDNKEERAPKKFSFTNLLFDENLENVLSPVLHPHSDPAVSTVAKFHPPPHQQFDAAVSTVPHQHYDAAVSTVDQLFAHYDDVKGQLNIVYEYAGATDARDRHARWLEKNMHPADISKRLKLLPRKDLLVQIPTFRLIYYVDQYNKKNPLHPTKLLQAFGIAGFNEKALIKSVFLPNMDKKVIAQTSGMVEVQHIVSQENFDKALQRLQQYAKTQITKDLINFWLEKELGVKAVMARLGLSPQNLRTGYDFSRYKTLVMYVDAWNSQLKQCKDRRRKDLLRIHSFRHADWLLLHYLLILDWLILHFWLILQWLTMHCCIDYYMCRSP